MKQNLISTPHNKLSSSAENKTTKENSYISQNYTCLTHTHTHIWLVSDPITLPEWQDCGVYIHLSQVIDVGMPATVMFPCSPALKKGKGGSQVLEEGGPSGRYMHTEGKGGHWCSKVLVMVHLPC